MPYLRVTLAYDADGLNAWIHGAKESWAVLSAIGGGRTIATRGGPRRRADELETAWDTWLDLGSPDLYDFGMAITDNSANQHIAVHRSYDRASLVDPLKLSVRTIDGRRRRPG